MRKILIIFLAVMLSTSTVHAADSLYRMLYADEVEDFAKEQDAIVLFQVIESDGVTIKGQVLHVISGDVDGDIITIVDDDIRLLGMLPEPELQVGDYCVMSVKQYGNHYEQAMDALKADSGDYKTLKFYYSSHFTDIDALQYYVNSGGVEKAYQFNGVHAFVIAEDGTKKDITLPREAYLPEVEEIEASEDVVVNPIEKETTTSKPSDPPTKNPGYVIALVLLVVLVGVIAYGFGRYRSRSR